MNVIQQDRFLRALRRQPVDRTPVWLMRQAGRYLPEYRATRARAGSFMALCQNPELAAEVTLQPLARYDLDAAILFSDILTIPDAMGLGLHFVEGEGPIFERPIKQVADIAKLGVPDPEAELAYVPAAVRAIRRALGDSLPLIGFCGSPWTLAVYMLGGGSQKGFATIKHWVYEQPQALQQLLALLAQACTLYLQAQIAAGVDVVMIFDTWGGILTTSDYQQFSLSYAQTIIHALANTPATQHIPSILFTKGGGLWLESMAATGCTAVGVDWTVDLNAARMRVGQQVAIQGNLDPACLFAPPARIEAEVEKLLSAFGPYPGHIFNLGHGIEQHTPPEHVTVMIEALQRLSTNMFLTMKT